MVIPPPVSVNGIKEMLPNITLINADSSFSTGLYPEAVLISINQRKMINQAVHTIYS